MARKKIEIDWNLVDEMLKDFCEGTEVADALGIHKETLYDAVKATFNTDFSDYKAQKRARGCQSLRQKQVSSANKGNVSMLIWLGKQYLGQSDKTDHTTKGESLNQINVTADNNNSKKELEALIGFAAQNN